MKIAPPDSLAPGLELAWAVSAVLLALGVVLHGHEVDVLAFGWINAWAPAVAGSASALSVLGLGAAAFLGYALLGLRRTDLLALFLVTLLIGGVAVHVVKWLSVAPRPAALLGASQITVIGIPLHARSMPSGHSATWAAVATLAWFTVRANAGAAMRLGLSLALPLLAAAGALARVAVGAHWPADLLVGAGLGVASAGLAMTPPGRRVAAALERLLRGPLGPWLLVPTVAATTWALARSIDDYPLAIGTTLLLVALGCVAAAAWATRLRVPGLARLAPGRHTQVALRE